MKSCITLAALSVLALTIVGLGGSVQAASIINGDFSLGATGFTTEYLPIDCDGASSYNILTSPYPCHTQWWQGYDHTTGEGLFMVLNGAQDLRIIWAQDVSVDPGRNYIFSFWHCSLFGAAPAILEVRVNGAPLGNISLPTVVGEWRQFSVSWNSGTATTAVFSLVDLKTDYYGNDFGIDDIAIEEVPPGEETVAVEVTVTGKGTGQPVIGAEVILLEDGVARIPDVTDEDGKGNLNWAWGGPGRYYTVMARKGNREAVYDLGRFQEGVARSITMSIPVYIELTGLVIDKCNKRGIEGAQVDVYEIGDTQTPVGYSITNGEGLFTFDTVQPGTYLFASSKQGQIPDQGNALLYKGAVSDPVVVGPESWEMSLGQVALETNVVVLVHGIKSGADAWNAAAYPESLRAENWVVPAPVDLPGLLFGQHGFAMIKDQAQFLKAQIDPLGVESVNIVAHSQGGLVSRYMNENLAEKGGMVNKLIALATPHHGSPLARWPIGIRKWLFDDVTGYESYTLPDLIGTISDLWPSWDDLAPNSDFIKELNQREAKDGVKDWGGICGPLFGNPATEKGLQANTAYVTIRGDAWGDEFSDEGRFMKITSGCEDSDGIVPTISACLYNTDGGNVFNLWLDHPVHHKADIKGMLEDSEVRDIVCGLLATEPPTGLTAEAFETVPKAKTAGDWTFLGYRELMLPPAGSREDSITVDYCDTLAVDWSWFEGDVDLVLESPSGAVIDSAFAALDPYVSLDLDRDAKWGRYLIEFPESGSWTLIAESANSTIEQNIVPLVSAAGSIRMSAAIEAVGEETFADRIIQVELQSFTGLAVENADVSVVWTGPTGTTGTLALLDDGLPPDTAANDGVYSGQLGVEAVLGTTTLEIEAIGMEPEAFSRRNLLSIVTSQVFDLAVAAPGLSAVSTNGLALSPVELLATITNNGEGDAEVTVRFSTGSGLVLADSVMIVPAQGSLEVTADHLPLADGLFEYELAVAPSGDYADADLANNTAVTALPIGPAVTGVPDVPGPGDETGEEIPGRTGILTAYPNPFNPAVRLEFALKVNGEARVRIFDLRGRLVRDLFSGRASAGRLALDWDGADDSGRRAATGAYLVHFRSGGDQDVRKIMLLK